MKQKFRKMNIFKDLMEDLDDLNNFEFLLRERNVRKMKLYKLRKDPFVLNDDDFKCKYRFSKEYARRIIEIVKEDVTQDPRGGSIPSSLQVLVALRTWARNDIQDDAGDLHGTSQQSISNICCRVGTALARRAPDFIRMPTNNAEQQAVMAQFHNICGFRNVIGVIDCTHIRIKKMPGEVSKYYINKKGFYSLNVQVICDATLRIRDIVAHRSGSTHDSRIFKESKIKQRFEEGEFKGRLLGDSAYPCTPYLFTPVLHPSTENEEAYNRSHILTRNEIERCFGVWKQRFQCLLKGFSCSLENTKTYIVALAVLHNIAIEMGEQNDFQCVLQDDPAIAEDLQELQSTLQGQAARTAFINSYF